MKADWELIQAEGKVMPSEPHQVAGMFRDPMQARLAVEAARKRGVQTHNPDRMVQDAEDVRVSVGTTGSVLEEASSSRR